MNDLNSVVIFGRLVRDPELKNTSSGKSVVIFSVAVNRKYGETENVSYFNCDAWGKTGEAINKYFQKGNRILVKGQLRQNRWEFEGKTRSDVRIFVEEFYFIDKKNEDAKNLDVNVNHICDDDPPF